MFILQQFLRQDEKRVMINCCLALIALRNSMVSAKGGGYSGGGGSTSSGGYYGGGYGSYGSSSDGDSTSGLVIGISVAVAVGAFFVCSTLSSTAQNQKAWNAAFLEAQKDVMEPVTDVTRSSTNYHLKSFTEGTFVASYNDSSYQNGNTEVSSNGTLKFKRGDSASPPAGGTSISAKTRSIVGNGTDRDGDFVISNGKVSLDTGKAYWVEKAKGSNIKSLVTGKFSWSQSSKCIIFAGSFRCTNGAKGKFSEFKVLTQDEELTSVAGAFVAEVEPRVESASVPPMATAVPLESFGAAAVTTDIPSIFVQPSSKPSASHPELSATVEPIAHSRPSAPVDETRSSIPDDFICDVSV
ncbi:unknown protein [Seminavis robusta]|uniref:Uncharacterized protein n=1 Tax=Seminavis robusta TaxID=568900 RepID=A0A9N8ENW8_9STRA|nr:unknown protein [Seminavis robusta]|eukprot:Sro1339_g264360.1 n/a (354) ;mRNA; f:30344-31405